jgi:hypothetical protein
MPRIMVRVEYTMSVAATKVSGHPLDCRSSHPASSKYSCRAATFVPIHSELDGKHLLVEQVVETTLLASLKG